jgi:4,4'-diaponeurosporenoate glycosyltransferase
VVPARDEAAILPRLLAPLRRQLHAGDELVVVDDHSTDATAAIAASCGARVVAAPGLPSGWIGKPHACWTGANSTTAATLVFLDADVRPGPSLLDGLAAAVAAAPHALVSLQPWSAADRPTERLTILAPVVALMGSGAFTVLGPLVPAEVAFGPVLAIRRDTYDHAGGHAHDDVRSSLVEDIALARRVGCSEIFTDRRDATSHRAGLRASLTSWTRTIAFGIAATRWWITLATVAWVWSLAGGPFAGWLAYPLSAVQVWVLGRRVGRCGPIVALLYPLAVAVLVVIVAGAGWQRVRGASTWKRRRV